MAAVRKPTPRALVVSAPDFAEALNIHVKTVYRMIDRGEIRAIKVGHSLKIPRSEIERILSGDARSGAE